MPIGIDPQIGASLALAADQAIAVSLPERGDALGLRAWVDQVMDTTYRTQVPKAPDVTSSDHHALSEDGYPVPLRWYTRHGSDSAAAVVYLHGGGMICGTLDNYDPLVRYYVQATGVPFLAVGYRLAPEFTHATPARDGFSAVQWLLGQADTYGIDPSRIAIMGDSGGGGVAAGAAILARDHKVALAKQVLVFPMLDDRNTEPDPLLAPTATWTYDNNYTAWHALLGTDLGAAAVSPIAAPARLDDFRDLAPAYLEVGDLDIFRDESVAYAAKLMQAGVSCELHVYPGCPHGYDWLDSSTDVSQRAVAERIRVLRQL